MAGGAGVCGEPEGCTLPEAGTVVVVGALCAWVLFAPNSQDVISRFEPAIGVGEGRGCGVMGGGCCGGRDGLGVVMAVVFAACFLSLSNVTEFLYYQF